MRGRDFKKLASIAVDIAGNHLANLSEGSVWRPVPARHRRYLASQSLSENGIPAAKLLELISSDICPYPAGNGHPRFFAWISSPPSPSAIVADFLASSLNPSCAGGDHAAAYLEWAVIDWLGELVGYPSNDETTGLLVSGGSMANLTALTAARHWVSERDGWDVRGDGVAAAPEPLRAYASEEGHSSLTKAIEVLGLGRQGLRRIGCNGRGEIHVQALRARIRADRADGKRPFCVIASAGTANTGAVDPIEELADVCAQERMWLHVDGAYGAFAALDPSLASLFSGMGRAHSLTLDPHKWLSVPIDAGCVLVHDAELMRRAFEITPPYLKPTIEHEDGMKPAMAKFGIELTRGFRALKIWMTLQESGRAGIRDTVVHHVRLARHLGQRIAEADDFELAAVQTLGIVCFRHVPAGWASRSRIDALNEALVDSVQRDGRVFLAGTVVGGRPAFRVCFVHPRTTIDDVELILTTVRELARAKAGRDG